VNNRLRHRQFRRAILIACLSVAIVFLVSGSLLAQDEISKYFEITGGKSESIPIQLNVGQMVQGELIIKRTGTIRLSMSDFSGKSFYLFGETSTRGGFYYTAETSGPFYLVVTNPKGFSVGTTGCTVNYSIVPTNLQPGTGLGKKVTNDMTKPSISMTTVLLITGIIVFLGILLWLVRGRLRPIRYRRYSSYENDDDEYDVADRDVHVYHHRRTRCPRCGGTGKVDPPPINRVFGVKWECPRCRGNGWIWG